MEIIVLALIYFDKLLQIFHSKGFNNNLNAMKIINHCSFNFLLIILLSYNSLTQCNVK